MSEPGTAEWRRAEANRLITFGRAAALADGGFGWLGADGEIDATQPRPLYLNSRMTHVFALAHADGVAGAQSLAASGLATEGRDEDDGPVRLEVGGRQAEQCAVARLARQPGEDRIIQVTNADQPGHHSRERAGRHVEIQYRAAEMRSQGRGERALARRRGAR